MNVFDVHVNRSPINATITEKHYIPGAYVNASLDKASHDNERMALILDAEDQKGLRIGVVQIAGLVARRIICERDEKDRLSAGQVFGIIRFGAGLMSGSRKRLMRLSILAREPSQVRQ